MLKKLVKIMNPTLYSEKSNEKLKENGCNAIARGAFEAGVVLATGFPGAPASQILESFTEIASHNLQLSIHSEFSINEKVAFEVALAGSMCNARNLLVTKHVGLNNAADSFMTGCYAGAMGGLVVVIVDDPGMFFSQNEQDSRYYGLHGLIPVFEPSTPGEAKEMTKYAFEFSEKFESLVLLRITAAFCGESGEIQLGDLQQLNRA